MNVVSLFLTAEEPLVITDGSAEKMGHQTLQHIPGNMLLGAFAARWKQRNPKENPDEHPEFRALFLSGAVQWGHAYPCLEKAPCVPIPLSFQKIKNHDGLPTIGDTNIDDCRVVNLLRIPDDERLQQRYAQHFSLSKEEPVKLNKLAAGFMTEGFIMPSVPQQWTMHVALSEQRMAAESQLFGYSAIASGATFLSEIFCQDDATTQAVLALTQKTPFLCVGHARSAGYGRVRCQSQQGTAPTPPTLKHQSATIFLVSDYLPRHSWESPLESFCAELEKALGVQNLHIDERHRYCAYASLAGFHGQWRLPRRTRTALKRGGVLLVSWEGKANTAPHSLGGWQQEGYGRLCFDPDFLTPEWIAPTEMPTQAASAPVPAPTASPLLHILWQRGLKRQAQEAAMQVLHHDNIQRFLKSVASESQPSQSQRGNLRQLITTQPYETWLPSFKEMLEKTPGQQWKNAEGFCPLEDYPDTLSEIMPRLLHRESFITWAKPTVTWLGGNSSPDEEHDFHALFHRLALLELLNAWEKAVRLSQHAQSKENC